MSAKKVYHYCLLIIATLVIYYIFVAGFNLIFKLAIPNQPACQPAFCKEIAEENAFCLIRTPGFSNCVNIRGYFYVLSAPLAYSLLLFSLIATFYFSKRFYLTRIFFVLLIPALVIAAIRILLGSLELSATGFFTELRKLGLYQSFVQTFWETLLKMFNPEF